MNMIKRAKYVMSGECGGPSVETIVGIAVALIIGVAFIAFGRMIVGWVGNASDSVNSMEVGNLA